MGSDNDLAHHVLIKATEVAMGIVFDEPPFSQHLNRSTVAAPMPQASRARTETLMYLAPRLKLMLWTYFW